MDHHSQPPFTDTDPDPTVTFCALLGPWPHRPGPATASVRPGPHPVPVMVDTGRSRVTVGVATAFRADYGLWRAAGTVTLDPARDGSHHRMGMRTLGDELGALDLVDDDAPVCPVPDLPPNLPLALYPPWPVGYLCVDVQRHRAPTRVGHARFALEALRVATGSAEDAPALVRVVDHSHLPTPREEGLLALYAHTRVLAHGAGQWERTCRALARPGEGMAPGPTLERSEGDWKLVGQGGVYETLEAALEAWERRHGDADQWRMALGRALRREPGAAP